MRLPLLRRMLNVAALGTGVAALAAMTASPAHAGVEVGATAGLHVFSINNELGVPDEVKATSLRNSALFGVRLGFMFTDMLGVEVEGGRFRHTARFVRWRPDRDAPSCTYAQLDEPVPTEFATLFSR